MKRSLTFSKRSTIFAAASVSMGLLSGISCAQTTVKDAWVRATVFQQKTTGAFMEITSERGARLISASTPLARLTEIHEMRMEADVMRMAAVPGVDLPAGVTVPFKAGGFHIMMMGLKAPLQAGTVVPLTLTLRSASGALETLEIQAPVRPLGFLTTPMKAGPVDPLAKP